jgi:hypothetical protein
LSHKDYLSAYDLDEAISRNADVISDDEQATLGSSRVLVAGCGSVGGSVVEPLARLGLGGLVLADPDRYDLSNMNRQACYLEDVGRPKAVVLKEHAERINPYVDAQVFADGLTLDNLRDALEGVSAVFDGIDVAASPWIKYRLHELASELRIPVICGLDLGGKALTYTFDYRSSSREPFYGRTTAEAHRQGRFTDCLSWVGYSRYPADFLTIVQDRLVTKRPWPQVAYCVQAMGALGARGIVDVLMQRRIPHIMAFDVHMKSRQTLGRLGAHLRFPVALAKAYLTSKRAPVREALQPAVQEETLQAVDPILAKVLEAMLLAPSPHNCQPWKFIITGPREFRLSWDRARGLPAVDPEAFGIAYSLGCALEAASSVADIEFKPSGLSNLHEEGYYAGTIRVNGMAPMNYARNSSLLRKRATSRGTYVAVPHSVDLMRRIDGIGASLGTIASLRTQDNARVRALSYSRALKLFRRADYVDELFAHFRLSTREGEQQPTGFTSNGLNLGRASVFILKALRSNKRIRQVAFKFGLARAMAASTTASVGTPSSFLLIATSDWSAQGRINAGRAVMRIWLELTKSNLACQPNDFPISDEEGRAEISRLFGLGSGVRPVMLMRVGRTTSGNGSRSLRLPLASLCTFENPGASARKNAASTETVTEETHG